MIDINKGCWTNWAMGILGIFLAFRWDSPLMGVIGGLNIGYAFVYFLMINYRKRYAIQGEAE